jgi:hypothetical protein
MTRDPTPNVATAPGGADYEAETDHDEFFILRAGLRHPVQTPFRIWMLTTLSCSPLAALPFSSFGQPSGECCRTEGDQAREYSIVRERERDGYGEHCWLQEQIAMAKESGLKFIVQPSLVYAIVFRRAIFLVVQMLPCQNRECLVKRRRLIKESTRVILQRFLRAQLSPRLREPHFRFAAPKFSRRASPDHTEYLQI